jgi:hypothetical protein
MVFKMDKQEFSMAAIVGVEVLKLFTFCNSESPCFAVCLFISWYSFILYFVNAKLKPKGSKKLIFVAREKLTEKKKQKKKVYYRYLENWWHYPK